MPGAMPYQLEKGPYFSVTESVLDDIQRRIWILAWLRTNPNAGFDDMPTLDSTTLRTPPGVVNPGNLYTHQNKHWYGKKGKQPQPKYNAKTNRTTGYWHNWYGDAEGIVREVFVRAIEVSLGVPHDPDQVDLDIIERQKRREWPIEVFWRCPAPWFEGWVTWRGRPHGVVGDVSHTGHVTIHFHTPSHYGSALLKSPLRLGNVVPEYRDEFHEPGKPPKPFLSSEGDRGMWVVAQRQQDLRGDTGHRLGSIDSTKGDWKLERLNIGAHYVSEGEVVVVQPSEPNGGVLAGGRPYFATRNF
jgi:hypothetical protein